jgi:hypothetical protein
MSEEAPAITMANTKKEMLAAYSKVLERLEQQREARMQPQERVEEKKDAEAVATAAALTTEAITQDIAGLKSRTGQMLNEITERLESATAKYHQVERAVAAKEAELREIYEIQKAASSLKALIEAQQERRDQFAEEMDEKKEALDLEISEKRAQWKQEQAAYEVQTKERNAREKQERERETEQYTYKAERERTLAQEQFEYEKAKMEREIAFKREQMEKDLTAREQAVDARESELQQLQAKAEGFPKELEQAVAAAAKEAKDRATGESSAREELLKREYQGQIDVLQSRIEALQSAVKEQNAQIAKLSGQLEKSYGQVQDIATKAIEGSSRPPVVNVQPPKTERPRGSSQGDE